MLVYITIYGICFTNDQLKIHSKFTSEGKNKHNYSGKSTTPIEIKPSHIFTCLLSCNFVNFR